MVVAVVVIGILAAIAIPTYVSQQSRAYNAAVISDLRNLALEMSTFEAGHQRLPTREEWCEIRNSVTVSGEAHIWALVNQHSNNGNGAFLLRGEHQRTSEKFEVYSTNGQEPTLVTDWEYPEPLGYWEWIGNANNVNEEDGRCLVPDPEQTSPAPDAP